jgi:hypothetical protein
MATGQNLSERRTGLTETWNCAHSMWVLQPGCSTASDRSVASVRCKWKGGRRRENLGSPTWIRTLIYAWGESLVQACRITLARRVLALFSACSSHDGLHLEMHAPAERISCVSLCIFLLPLQRDCVASRYRLPSQRPLGHVKDFRSSWVRWIGRLRLLLQLLRAVFMCSCEHLANRCVGDPLQFGAEESVLPSIDVLGRALGHVARGKSLEITPVRGGIKQPPLNGSGWGSE